MEKDKKKKKKYQTLDFLIIFLLVMGIFGAIRHVFALDIPLHIQESRLASFDEDDEFYNDSIYTADSIAMAEHDKLIATVTARDTMNLEVSEEYVEVDSMPFDHSHHETSVDSPEDNLVIEHPITPTENIEGKAKHRVVGVWSYDECFPDINDIQLLAAQKNGIRPIKTREDAEKQVKRHKLVNIYHSPFYTVDELTHSMPYLVPKAQDLLNKISINFIDSLQMKGLPPHTIIVTSALRSKEDVSNLQHGNKNATTNSCHCYGTTIDIAYNKFVPVTGSYDKDNITRWNDAMKKVLAEVLDDLRRERKCYVKYERKQGCFHLTCR